MKNVAELLNFSFILGQFPDFVKSNRKFFAIFKNLMRKPGKITISYKIISFFREYFPKFCESPLSYFRILAGFYVGSFILCKIIKQIFQI